jgi:hypothetical protein
MVMRSDRSVNYNFDAKNDVIVGGSVLEKLSES